MFLSFEGGDGCGKTTQIERLKATLTRRGVRFVATREPGGTALAEALRGFLLHGRGTLEARAELLLFGAARAQHVAEVIQPALTRGEWVLCDRFGDSSVAYQGGGLGLDADFIRAMNAFATDKLQPDITFWLDLPPEIAARRRLSAADDRIEARGLEFQRRVREAYAQIAARESARFCVLDAEKTPDELAALIEARLFQTPLQNPFSQ